MKGFRTIIANIVMSLPLLADPLGQILNAPEMRDIIPAQDLPYYGLGMVVVNLILRSITTTPVGKSS